MTCPKCYCEHWCKEHKACARSVRASWIIWRRNGFKDWRSGPRLPEREMLGARE